MFSSVELKKSFITPGPDFPKVLPYCNTKIFGITDFSQIVKVLPTILENSKLVLVDFIQDIS